MSGWPTKKFIKSIRKKHVKLWQLFLVTVILAISSVFLLRQNNLNMIELRSQVVEADKAGDGVNEALQNLNSYIFNHMNTQVVRPIELVNTYNRQAQAVIEASQRAGGRDIYAEGTAVCERRGIPLSSIAQCIAQYANDNSAGMSSRQIILPDKNLFIYSFASPVWTPDLAGILVLLTGVSLIWLSSRLVELLIVSLVVRHRLKNGL
jgi:hypothetical protein